MTIKINIMYLNNWDVEKQDPAFFDKEMETIFVRPDYDIDEDIGGWIVREQIHAYLDSIHFEDNYNPPLVVCPYNDVEKYACIWQFVYLLEIKRIHSLESLRRVMPWKFQLYGDKWARKYLKEAYLLANLNDDPTMPPNMIVQGGPTQSWEDANLENHFRKIVDDAKKKYYTTHNEEMKSTTNSVENGNSFVLLKICFAILFLIVVVFIFAVVII